MSTRDDPSETAHSTKASTSARVIHYAARRMPTGLAERLEEEWIADLAEQHGTLARMRFALGCYWATHVIGREPSVYGARLSAASHGSVGVINAPYPSPIPRRAAVLLVIVFLHIAAALALIYAIRVHVLPIPQPPMTWKYFDSSAVTPPLPMPRPQLEDRPANIPMPPPLGTVPYDSEDSPPPISSSVTSPPLPAQSPVRVAGGIGKGFPNTADFYPSSAIRLGEAGITAVSVCVDNHGRLTADPKVAISSGSPRLDSGALELARAASGHYRSTTENGKAINACFQIGVHFALKNS